MNTTPENTTPKKPRALPRQWKRFIHLEIGDHFFIGRCRYIKRGFFSALAPAIPTARRITVPPWRKVQTDVLVREAVRAPAWDGRVAMSMNEDPDVCGHYVLGGMDVAQVGADVTRCEVITPGHPDNPIFGGHGLHQQGCSSEDMARVPQPNSDNNITGPTS